MEVSDITPDELRDPPKGSKGTMQCPGGYIVLPARAYGDNRFNNYPKTFRALGICCAHANKNTGGFYVNQKTIAKVLECSQQAASQHLNKLVKYGYLEKLRKENTRRPFGKQGAYWRIIYDTRYTEEDAWVKTTAQNRDEETEKVIALQTINEIQNVNKKLSTGNKKPVDNSIPIQAPACIPHKPQLVENDYLNYKDNKNIREENGIDLCIAYARLCEEIHAIPWRQNREQVNLAMDILREGHTIDSFIELARRQLVYMLKKEKRPPYSLAYFITMKKNKKEPATPKEVVERLTSRLRMR